SYRLIGYEDRLLAKQDFNDDKKDAGDIGAGKTVTAFYEVAVRGAANSSTTAAPAVDPLKYQSSAPLPKAAEQSDPATVNGRHKPPSSDTSTKLSYVVGDSPVAIADATADFRFGAAVASAALVLRGAPNMHTSLDAVRALASGAVGNDASGERREFVALL